MKAFCTNCGRETNHKILQESIKNYSDEEVSAQAIWQIIECNGCENVSFKEIWTNSEDIDPEDGHPIESIKLYPIRSEDYLPIKNFYNVPFKVRSIYRELIDAYNNDLNILCSGGLRATIEGICNNEKILDGPVEIVKEGTTIIKRSSDLRGKIGGLYEKGLLTKPHAETLHEHRFLGNEALHSLNQPSKEELKIAIEIVEHTLEALYELKEKVDDLKFKKQKRSR